MFGSPPDRSSSSAPSDTDQAFGSMIIVGAACLALLFVAKYIPIALLGALFGFFISTAWFQPSPLLRLQVTLRNTFFVTLFFFLGFGFPLSLTQRWVGALFYSQEFCQLCLEIVKEWNGIIPHQKLFYSLKIKEISPLIVSQYAWLSYYASIGFSVLFFILRFFGKLRSEVSDSKLRFFSFPARFVAKIEDLLFYFWIRLGKEGKERPVLFFGPALFLLGLAYFFKFHLASQIRIFEFDWLISYVAFIPILGLGLGIALSLTGLGGLLTILSKKMNTPTQSPGFLLGQTFSGKSFRLSEKNLNYHVELVAPTGSGKTNLLKSLIADRIQKGHGVIFLDFKADFEIVSWAYRASKSVGRENDLRLFSLSDPNLSVPYNPFKLGDATAIQSALMNSMTWSEDFYRGVASVTLSTLIRSLCEYRDKTSENFHLGHIHELLENPSLMRVLADKMAEIGCTTASKLSELASRIEKPSERSNLMGLISNLNQILFSSAGELLSIDTTQGSFDFREATSQGEIVVMLMNSLKLKESAQLVGKIILQDLMSFVGDHYARVESTQVKPITLIIDEFASFAMPNFIEFMDRARGAGIGIVLAHQARADLKSISPEFQERIEANSNTILVSGVKNSADAEYYAGMLGTKTVRKETLQKKDGLFWDESTGMKSVRDVEEFVLHPNEIRKLNQGELFAISRTIDPNWGLIRVKKAPEFQEYQTNAEVLTQHLKAIRESYLNQTEVHSLDLSFSRLGFRQKSEELTLSKPSPVETWN